MPFLQEDGELTHPDLHIAFPMLAAARKKQGHLARRSATQHASSKPLSIH